MRDLFTHVSAEDLRLRFFASVKDSASRSLPLTQLDYGRAMAFAAFQDATGALLGVGRLHAAANYEAGEYAVLLRSDFKGHGLGWTLMQMIIAYARSEGLRRIEGQVLRENSVMLRMCNELGFAIKADPQDREVVVVSSQLAPPDR